MDDIKAFKEKENIIIESKKLGVADFGPTFEDAKDKFKKAVKLMLDCILDELKLTEKGGSRNK